MARLDFLVEQGRRLGLLIGSRGSGKSLLLEVFAHQMRQAGNPVAKLNLVGVAPAEFLWLLAVGLGLNPDRDLPWHALWRIVTDRLAEYRYQQLKVVVLLDDADCAVSEVLTQVARLVQVDPSPECRLTVVLAGRPERIRKLGEGLMERADLRINLDPWQPADTEAFVRDSLAKAGRSQPAFSASAIARLHELAQGVPRRVSQLAELALLAGAGCNIDQIDADTIESVYHELGALEV